jgi:hypothetical protein
MQVTERNKIIIVIKKEGNTYRFEKVSFHIQDLPLTSFLFVRYLNPHRITSYQQLRE